MTERLKKFSRRWFLTSTVIALIALFATGVLGMMYTFLWFIPFQIGIGAIGMMTTIFIATLEDKSKPEGK